MHDQIFQILILIFCTLVSIIGTFIAWWVNNIHTTVKTQTADINNLKLEVVRDYVPRKEVKDTCDRIFEKIDEISKSLQHLSNNHAAMKAIREELAKEMR
jgi:DNA-directed RNA polymerase subunit L